MIERLSNILVGDYTNYSLENRVYNASALLTSIAALNSLIVNLFSGYGIISHIIYIIFIGVFMLLYYLGRFRNIYKGLYYYIPGIIAISFLWFLNEGLHGTVPLVFTVSILVFTSIIKIRYHFVILITTLAVIGVLVVLELYYYEELIVRFSSNETRQIQLIFGLVLSVCVIFIFAHSLKKNFLRENEIIKKQEQEIRKISRTKDKLFSIISHDLRDPFNSIIGLSDLMADETEDISLEEMRKYAGLINRTAENAFRLLINLLNWSRLNQGNIPFQPQNVHLLPIVNDCIDIVKDISDKKEISVSTEIDEELKVNADLNMIQVILRNLLSNAIKFTNQGGVVKVFASITSGNKVKISVTDSGVGMSQDIINNLFEIDKEVLRAGTDGEAGTGLGLLLCKGFVDIHDCEIWVESNESTGSSFYFTMPSGIS